MNQIDYSKIVLTKKEQTIFDKFKDTDSAALSTDEFHILKNKDLICNTIDGKTNWFEKYPSKGICVISDKGRNLRAYQLIEKRKDFKRIIWNIINTVLAATSVIVSIIALIKS